MRRKTWALSALAATVLVAGGAGAAWWVVHQRTGDIHRGSDLPFTLTTLTPRRPARPARTASTTPETPARRGRYGRNAARTRDASDIIRSPRRSATSGRPDRFLEYPPSYRGRHPLSRLRQRLVSARRVPGTAVWTRPRASASTASPRWPGPGLRRCPRPRVYALGARTGQVLWRPKVGARSSRSPLYCHGRVYRGDTPATSAPSTGDRPGRMDVQAGGSGEKRPLRRQREALLRRLLGRDVRTRVSTGELFGGTHTTGSLRLQFGQLLLDTGGRLRARYIGNTDGKVYAFEATMASRLDVHHALRAYGSPGIARGRVYATSYDGTFAALSARTGQLLWRHSCLQDDRVAHRHRPARLCRRPRERPRGARPPDGLRRRHGPAPLVLQRREYSTVIAAGGRLIVAGVSHLYALLPRTAPRIRRRACRWPVTEIAAILAAAGLCALLVTGRPDVRRVASWPGRAAACCSPPTSWTRRSTGSARCSPTIRRSAPRRSWSGSAPSPSRPRPSSIACRGCSPSRASSRRPSASRFTSARTTPRLLLPLYGVLAAGALATLYDVFAGARPASDRPGAARAGGASWRCRRSRSSGRSTRTRARSTCSSSTCRSGS